jgi:hypothetical protein
MRYLYILFFITTVAILGCKKKTPVTHVNGTVINTGTKQPIAGILVVMQDGVGNNTGGLSPGSKNVGSGATQQITTSADGRFSFSFQGEAPVIWAEHTQYRFLNPNGAYEIYTMVAGKDYSNLQLTMDAYAWFNPILKGHNSDKTDSMLLVGGELLIPPMGGGYFTYEGNGPYKFTEGLKGLIARGDLYYPYGIKWQEHGVWQAGRTDSVYIKSFAIYTDTIYY